MVAVAGEVREWLYLNPATDDLWEFAEARYTTTQGTQVLHLRVRYVPAHWEADDPQLADRPPTETRCGASPEATAGGSCAVGDHRIPPEWRLWGEAPASELRALRVELFRRAMAFVHSHDVRGGLPVCHRDRSRSPSPGRAMGPSRRRRPPRRVGPGGR